MTVVYVCAATRWQSVNLVPALAIGPIDRFLILSARRGGDFKITDAANSGRPQIQFADAFGYELARRGANKPLALPQVLTGPVVDIQGWRTKIREAIAALPQNSEIVVNYLSGPSDVKVAAWLALGDVAAARPDLRLRCVLYDPPAGRQPSQLEWNEWQTPAWQQRIEPVPHLISLGGWLRLHGFIETESESETREARQKAAHGSADLIRRHANLAFQTPGLWPGWLVEITGRIDTRPRSLTDLWELWKLDRDLVQVDSSVKNAAMLELNEIANQMRARFGEHGAKRLDRFQGGHDCIAYFRSGWFEELIYLELCRRLEGAPVQIALGLKTTVASDPRRQPYELDVAVIGMNQLHIVECKALNRDASPKAHQQFVDRARSLNEDLVGPGGAMLLASATGVRPNAAIRSNAAERQIEFAAGWNEIDAALDRIAQRCR